MQCLVMVYPHSLAVLAGGMVAGSAALLAQRRNNGSVNVIHSKLMKQSGNITPIS